MPASGNVTHQLRSNGFFIPLVSACPLVLNVTTASYWCKSRADKAQPQESDSGGPAVRQRGWPLTAALPLQPLRSPELALPSPSWQARQARQAPTNPWQPACIDVDGARYASPETCPRGTDCIRPSSRPRNATQLPHLMPPSPAVDISAIPVAIRLEPRRMLRQSDARRLIPSPPPRRHG